MAWVRRHVWVSGRVQGVFFRQFTLEQARKLGVVGFVRNLPDGRVEAIIEGPEEKVARLIERMRQGPPMARVENLQVVSEPPTQEFSDFEIRYD